MSDRLLSQDVALARERLAALGTWYKARPNQLHGRGSMGGGAMAELDDLVAADAELARVARMARMDLLPEVERRAGSFAPHLLAALLEIPRERFVLPRDIAASASDAPLLLDEEGMATISAPHAYLLSFRVLGLAAGDHLVELGSGSGYGAALASHVVTQAGTVLTVEIDEALFRRASRLLLSYGNVHAVLGDAIGGAGAFACTPGLRANRVSITFAVRAIPEAWLNALPIGGRLVAPVGPVDEQRLVRVERTASSFAWSDHGPVRYVPNRGREMTAHLPGAY